MPDVEDARAAGLRWVSDERPGIRRLGSPGHFRYVGASGQPVRDPATLARIRSLAIPPAWSKVWICPQRHGHIQATGRDARGRKQYRYHPRWREQRDANKYARIVAFGSSLGKIRAAVERDMALPGLPREKVLATVVKLLGMTYARVGNEEYARENRSYGLTTLEGRHVDVAGSVIRFRFRGKSGKTHLLEVKDPRLARIVRRCEELPGQHLFEYVDEEGKVRPIGSSDVNEYIREAAGGDFTAKDFRTLAGTVLAARALRLSAPEATKAGRKRVIMAAIRQVAERLGNTVAVCRRCYVHPAILNAYERAELGASLEDVAEEEAAVLRLVGGLRPFGASAAFGGPQAAIVRVIAAAPGSGSSARPGYRTSCKGSPARRGSNYARRAAARSPTSGRRTRSGPRPRPPPRRPSSG